MTADIGRLIFCLGLIFASLSSHGDCKDVPVDANQPFKATEAKLTKPIVAAGAVAGADEYSPVIEGARYDTQLPISVADVNDTSNSVTHSSGRIGKDDPTTRSSIHAAKPSKTFGSDDGFAEEVKKRLPDIKAKSKKTQEFESETDDGKGKQTDPKSRPRRPEIEDVEPTTKSDKPTIPSSRGKLKFQLDNSIGENGRSATAPPESGRVEDVSKLPLVKPNDSTSSNNDFSFTGSNGDVDAKTNRSAKSSFHYQGGDGYTFENQFAIDADRDDIKYEDKISTYPIHDPGNNIDRVRNFNENTGNVKLKNIVRKPQGFTLTTESTSEADVLRKTVTRFSATAGKRRFTESPIYVPKTEPVTDASSTAISKNEIVRKPSMKPSSTFSNRRRGPSSTTALNDNSLPTTSTAWALASLKPPASAKVQKRPSLELLKKNVAEVPQPMFVTTMKPFKSWSTKLMKTTTESATDIPTTMKPLAEVEAETLSPIAFSDPKLMNVSDIQSPNPMAESSKAVVEEAARNETTDIRIDLVEDTHKSPPTEGANSSHVKEIVDSTRYNYVVGNSSDDKNDTLITLNIHDADDTGKHVAVDEIKNSKNEIDVVPKPSAPKYNIPQADEPVKIQTTSTTERIRDVGLLNDVKSPSESNDFRNTTQAPVTSEAPRIDYQNTESNTIFDQIYKVKDHKEVVKEADTVTKNTSESNAVNGIDIGVQMVTKNLDPSEPSSGENSTKVVHGVEAVSEDGNREAATDASPMYDIEIDDDGSRTTGAVNETVVVDIKDIQANNVSTTTTTTTTEPETERPWATIPTLKLTPKTESLEDTMTTTRRTSPKRVYSTPAIMTLRPSTTMEMITVTNVPADEVTTFTSLLSSLRPTEVAGIFFKRKNTKLSPAPPRVSENTIVDELTTAAVPAVTETRRKYSRPTTTESIEETTSKAPPIVLPSSTETVDAVTLPDRRSSSEVPLIGSSTPADVTVVIDTTFPAVEDLPMGTFKPKLSPENVPAYLMLIFKSSFAYICQTKAALKENLFQYITERSARVQSKEQVIMVVDPEQCKEPDDSPRLIPVALYVVDDVGSYDKTLIDEMQAVLDVDNLNNYTIPIHKIVYQPNFVPDNSRVIAAMIITSIAAVCFVLLIFLMCTIRNRQKLSYGQRCTPVSVDDYNLDNISEYNNSVRRKGAMRASKRSYGNPAFDDPLGPSKNLTYNGLIKANENRCALDEEFSQIPVITVKPEELPAGAENKNRYANVIPLPETRVSLSNSCSDSVQDYINANYVKGFKGADRFYIACQAPLQNNIDDFWKMIWKEQSKVIIMLTGLSENGVEKCADYLPPSEVLDCHRLFGDYQVTLKKREVKEKYVISSLQLKNLENNLWREVTHLWYTNWPAQGVPSEQSSIIALLIEARAYMRNATGPHVVHCSPGTGRTGTVIACDICIRDYEMTRSVNIPLTVAKLRRCRAGAVQTKEQYAFIYKVLTLYAKKLNGGTPLESL